MPHQFLLPHRNFALKLILNWLKNKGKVYFQMLNRISERSSEWAELQHHNIGIAYSNLLLYRRANFLKV